MTSTAFRVRLAVALGLPLTACKSTPAPEPVAPAGSNAPQPVAKPTPEAPWPASTRTCGPDQIHEHACGFVLHAEEEGALAPAPFERCPAVMPKTGSIDLEWHHVLDGWKLNGEPEHLLQFRFDAAVTAIYKYSGNYYPEDPRCCFDNCNQLQALPKPRAKLAPGLTEYELCVPTPDSTKYPAATAKQCPAALRIHHFYPYGTVDKDDDAPFLSAHDDECCYNVATAHRCPPNTFEEDGGCKQPSPGGRPLREGDGFVVAPARASAEWMGAGEVELGAVEVRRVWSAATRATAAVAWAREAAFEHASVAAFARLALELMVHGAPAELVDAAHVAARDEIRHARMCYGLAAAFGDEAVGPGSLELSSIGVPTLEQFAVTCFRDGCVNETVAALCVAEGARIAGEPIADEDAQTAATRARLAATLASIAEDEARHAELSYRILGWALGQGGAALVERIRTELAQLRSELAHTGLPGDDGHDETTGLVSARTAAEVRRRVLTDVVVPCTEALLARS